MDEKIEVSGSWDKNAMGSQNYLDSTTTNLDGSANWDGIEKRKRYFGLGHLLVQGGSHEMIR